MFEFNGQLFENEVDFLDAVAKEYRIGDEQTALDALEEYGYDISDIKTA